MSLFSLPPGWLAMCELDGTNLRYKLDEFRPNANAVNDSIAHRVLFLCSVTCMRPLSWLSQGVLA
jgi:hypothetical protein